MSAMKELLIVAHAPSPNTQRMLQGLILGTQSETLDAFTCRSLAPLEASSGDVLRADAIILMTPENLGYMSGALKDFFDRIYYPCLTKKQGLPYAMVVRAGHDGTGTQRAIHSICTGLRWQEIQPPLVCKGEWQDEFVESCRDLGLLLSVGLDSGVF